MKKKTVSQLRKKLWELTSKYVRLSAADSDGFCLCVTCAARLDWIYEAQAGHFIPRAQGNATAWDLRNIHPQCYRCNINLGGNGAEYYPWMIAKYGQKEVGELRRLSKTTKKITKVEYEEMIDDMAKNLSELIVKRKNSKLA